MPEPAQELAALLVKEGGLMRQFRCGSFASLTAADAGTISARRFTPGRRRMGHGVPDMGTFLDCENGMLILGVK